MSPLAVWTSLHSHRPIPTVETARAHDAVIRDAHDDRLTPVPLRFGQWFEDEARLVATVAGRVPGWRELLRELAGTVEMGLRVTATVDPAPDPPAAAETGTAYMQALLARHRSLAALEGRRDTVLGALRAALGALVAKEYVAPDPGAGTLLMVAYLVRRPNLDAYRAAIDPVHEHFAELRFHATGPWPPYSFVA